MKRFGMAVAALLMCATMSFAQKVSGSKGRSVGKLCRYWQLAEN